jgi:hypothetical protein
MLFSFVVGAGRESDMVRDAHLFVLQILVNSFGTGWQGEMVRHRETFHGLGV